MTARLLILAATTRPGRRSRQIADWAHAIVVDRRSDLEVELADLVTIGLPFLDEPHHPSEGRYVHDHTKRWSTIVDRCDAVVVVTGEYNRSIPAPLKNGIDHLHAEWQHKPVAFISYSGGVSGGTCAVEQARQALGGVGAWPVAPMINLPHIENLFTRDEFSPAPGLADSLDGVIDELVRATLAARTMTVP